MDLQAKVQKGGSLFGNDGLPEMHERSRLIAAQQLAPAGIRRAGERGDEDRFGSRLPGGPGLLGSDESR